LCSLPIGPRPFAGIADGEGSRPRPKILDDGQYAESSFSGPEAVLAYLARYTHRVAISNKRLIAADAKSVTFTVKDYRIEGPGRYKTMTLATPEFIRRFLMHVLPKGFHRIRRGDRQGAGAAQGAGSRSAPARHTACRGAFSTQTAMPLLWRAHEGC